MGQISTHTSAKPKGAALSGEMLRQRGQEQDAGLSFMDMPDNSPVSERGMSFTHVPVRPRLSAGEQVQCCAKDGGSCSCSKCQEAAATHGEEDGGEEEAAQAAPEAVSSEPAAAEAAAPAPEQSMAEDTAASPAAKPEEPAAVSGSSLIVEDSATEVQAGQMKKTQFLQLLRESICNGIDPVLARARRSSEGCPYLNYWLDFYEGKDAAHIEQTAKKYAPDSAGAKSADEYISVVVQRAVKAAEIWVETGRVTGVPEGVPATVPGQPEVKSEAPAAGVQAKAKKGGVRETDDPRAIQQELGEGRPLASDVRSRMESAFGTSFSHVRTHTDGKAAAISDQVNARAFTVGNHMAFGKGEYQPGTMLGDALIAHELAHTIQQEGADASMDKMEVGSDGYESLERDADMSAAGVVSALWGKAAGKVSAIARNILPTLRTGLRLSRCDDKKAPAPSGSGSAAAPAAATTQSLSKKTISGPTGGNCGSYSWVIQWELDKPAGASGGHVIQHITAQYNVDKCDGTVKDHQKIDYLEAWPINAGQKVTKWAETGDTADDTYSDPSYGSGTKGNIVNVGSAAYYDGITLPADFIVNNPATQAHILPSTTNVRNIPGGSAAISHNLTPAWDCCPNTTKTTTFSNQA